MGNRPRGILHCDYASKSALSHTGLIWNLTHNAQKGHPPFIANALIDSDRLEMHNTHIVSVTGNGQKPKENVILCDHAFRVFRRRIEVSVPIYAALGVRTNTPSMP